MLTHTSYPYRHGMMWNANHVLDQALDPKTNGVPRNLFKSCKGIVLISVVEAGFIFTGSVGTGLLLAKKANGAWSAPSAIGLTGIGWGFIAGASMKDVMVFLLEDAAVAATAGDAGLKIGGQAELTAGNFGRSAEASANISNRGAGGTVSVSFSKGFFGGISLEGAILAPRTGVNETYYASSASPSQILFEDAVEVKQESLMPEIYKKLNMLANGETSEGPDATEKAKVDSAFFEAKKAGEEAANSPDVVHVNVAAEAAKEQSA
jgi:SH3 domain-containing YSC84-like protein 1